MLLQGNLPLDKESETLLGRHFLGVWNSKDLFWCERLEKEEKTGDLLENGFTDEWNSP